MQESFGSQTNSAGPRSFPLELNSRPVRSNEATLLNSVRALQQLSDTALWCYARRLVIQLFAPSRNYNADQF
jgi:hypothetical protein